MQLVLDLLVRAEDVGVVLRQVADAEEPVQDAGELVPVQVAGLREAEGQITIGMRREPNRGGSAPGSSSA